MTDPDDEIDLMDPDTIADNAYVLAWRLMTRDGNPDQHRVFRNLELHPDGDGRWQVFRAEDHGTDVRQAHLDYLYPDRFPSAQLLADHIVALLDGTGEEWPGLVRRPDDPDAPDTTELE